MSDAYTDPDPDEGGRNPLREHAKALEADNKRLAEEAAAGREAQRKLAFIEAGVDPTSPQGKLLAKAYDGDLTADAIKAAALEYGVIQAPPAVTAPPAEQQVWGQMTDNANQGAASAVSLEDRIRAATSPQEVQDILAQASAAIG